MDYKYIYNTLRIYKYINKDGIRRRPLGSCHRKPYSLIILRVQKENKTYQEKKIKEVEKVSRT